jgi:hypothetical protein
MFFYNIKVEPRLECYLFKCKVVGVKGLNPVLATTRNSLKAGRESGFKGDICDNTPLEFYPLR